MNDPTRIKISTGTFKLSRIDEMIVRRRLVLFSERRRV